jgi:hypothetical protein
MYYHFFFSTWGIQKVWKVIYLLYRKSTPIEAPIITYHVESIIYMITPWPESTSELYRPSDRRLSSKLVPTFANRGVSRSQRGGSLRPLFAFSRLEPLLFFQVAPQLCSRGWVDPLPVPLLLWKSGSAGNRSQTSGSVARNSERRSV